MQLNSNSDNSNFLLIQTLFSVLWPKNALANSNFCTFTVTNGKKNEDKYLIFTLIVVKYLLVYKQIFASPEKWNRQGICSLPPSPKYTLLPVTSTWQQFPFLALRKYETVLEKRADLPLERCPTTSPHHSTATGYLSYLFSGSRRALRISPFLGVYFVM